MVIDAGKPIVGEIHGYTLRHLRSGARAEHVDVVPSILIERIDKKRRPQDETHLAPLHPDLELVQHLLIDDVALLDVDAIDARYSGKLRHCRHLASAVDPGRDHQPERGGLR